MKTGPLVVSKANPRYFTVASDNGTDHQAVYLTGSHIWDNLHDGMGPGADCAGTAEQFDYDAYLDFLKERGHNLIRLWRWEQFRSLAAGGGFHLCMTPQPWLRTGPGTASDGKPKFDLSRFDQAYFGRLRNRVVAAGNRGIYVSVMLFDGWALHLSPLPYNVEGHPFRAANNINEININSIVDYQVLPLAPRIQALQEAYIKKVIDTVHDLPNVLYEVANESSGGGHVDQNMANALGLSGSPEWGDSTQWQYWVINLAKQYEQQMGYDKHPAGMTMQFPVRDQSKVNDPLFDSPADWISPGFDDQALPDLPGQAAPSGRWLTNPPANDGRKVVVSDTDHYAPGIADALWAWKTFLRGHNPILMDFGLIAGVNSRDDSFESFEPARYAMGDTRRYAEKMNLIAMEPRGELSSTGYALANPDKEYLILQPSDTAERFIVTLAPGTYSVQWYSVKSRETKEAVRVTVEADKGATFMAPFAEATAAVLYLKRE